MTLLKKIALGSAASLLASASAFANTTAGDAANVDSLGTSGAEDTFTAFRDTVMSWATGPLGTGIAVTMMLMGAGMGVAKNSPMPALSGVAGAAFLNWGPGIILSLTDGAML